MWVFCEKGTVRQRSKRKSISWLFEADITMQLATNHYAEMEWRGSGHVCSGVEVSCRVACQTINQSSSIESKSKFMVLEWLLYFTAVLTPEHRSRWTVIYRNCLNTWMRNSRWREVWSQRFLADGQLPSRGVLLRCKTIQSHRFAVSKSSVFNFFFQGILRLIHKMLVVPLHKWACLVSGTAEQLRYNLVLQLYTSNYASSILKSHPRVLIKFRQNWCELRVKNVRYEVNKHSLYFCTCNEKELTESRKKC
jgi:hypothetical protein